MKLFLLIATALLISNSSFASEINAPKNLSPISEDCILKVSTLSQWFIITKDHMSCLNANHLATQSMKAICKADRVKKKSERIQRELAANIVNVNQANLECLEEEQI